jgi:hypothetical protein
MRANSEQMQLGDSDNPYLDLHYDAAADAAPAAPGALCFSACAAIARNWPASISMN